jgi:hypothetical protein
MFTVGSVCRLMLFATGWQTFRWRRGWNGGAEVADTTVKRLLCCGFRRTGKVMGQVYQCWWRLCREINVFSQVWILHVLRFISICDLFTDPLSYLLISYWLTSGGNTLGAVHTTPVLIASQWILRNCTPSENGLVKGYAKRDAADNPEGPTCQSLETDDGFYFRTQHGRVLYLCWSPGSSSLQRTQTYRVDSALTFLCRVNMGTVVDVLEVPTLHPKIHSRCEWASGHVCTKIVVEHTLGGGWCPAPHRTGSPQNGRVNKSSVSPLPIGQRAYQPPPPWICWTKSYIHNNIHSYYSFRTWRRDHHVRAKRR